MSTPRALVLRAPGINCDRETANACRLVGFATELVHINQLLKEPRKLLDYHLLALPGGFSYGDDLGAGTLLGKNLIVHLEKELEQFINEGRLSWVSAMVFRPWCALACCQELLPALPMRPLRP